MITLLVSAWLTVNGAVAQDARITYAAPATRASVLIADLAKQTGRPLEVTPQTADEVLLVRVKDVPVEELLKHIAHAADAEWIRKGDALRLTRTTELQSAGIQRDTLTRAAAIDAALKASEDEIKKAPAWSEQRAQQVAEADQKQLDDLMQGNRVVVAKDVPTDLPARRIALKLLRLIGPTTLATIREGHRVVFALRPTAMQRALPGPAFAALTDFVSMQGKFASATKAEPQDTSRVVISSTQPSMGDGNPALGLGNGYIAISRNGNSLAQSISTLDPTSKLLASGTDYLILNAPVPADTAPEETPIKLSPASEAFLKEAQSVDGRGAGRIMISRTVIVSGENGRGNGKPVSLSSFPLNASSPEIPGVLREVLLQPESVDPINLMVADAFGKALDGNLVANFPDRSILTLAREWRATPFGRNRLLSRAPIRLGLSVTTKDGWTDITSAVPAYDRELRVNRAALGEALRTVARKGTLSVDELAKWSLAQANPSTTEDYRMVALRHISAIEAGRVSPLMAQPYGIRLLGTLTARQREWAMGDGLPMTELSGNQREWLAYALFQGDRPMQFFNMSTRTPGAVPRPTPSPDEPTLKYPEGLPANARLKLESDTEAGVLGFAGTSSSFLTPDSLAANRAGLANPELSAVLKLPTYTGFIPATQVSNTVTLVVVDEDALSQTIDSLTYRPDTQRVAYEGLPEDFRKRTEEALAAVGSTFQHVSVGTKTRKTP